MPARIASMDVLFKASTPIGDGTDTGKASPPIAFYVSRQDGSLRARSLGDLLLTGGDFF